MNRTPTYDPAAHAERHIDETEYAPIRRQAKQRRDERNADRELTTSERITRHNDAALDAIFKLF